jgi:protein-L-isoaspartate(D-aspartate) O-methyltransferase
MDDFSVLRQRMVDNQIRPGDVTEYRVIRTFLELPREAFVPAAQRPFAYSDRDLPLTADEGHPRFLLVPVDLARLVQELRIDDDDVVLDVGCGTGYSSAVLARLANSVVALEENPELARTAERTLGGLGIDNVAVVEGPLVDGWPSEAPYDAILIAGGVELVPPQLGRQLRDGGRLAVVEYAGRVGRAMLYERTGEDVTGRPLREILAPLLPGFVRERQFVF